MTKVQDSKNFWSEYDGWYLDEETRIQLIGAGQPNCLTSNFVDRPCCVLSIGFLTLFLISVVAQMGEMFTQSDGHNRDYLIWTDQKVIDYDKLVAGRETIQAAQAKDELPIRIQNTEGINPFILISSPNEKENLLEKKNLLKMLEMENKIKEMKDWPLFCKAKTVDD